MRAKYSLKILLTAWLFLVQSCSFKTAAPTRLPANDPLDLVYRERQFQNTKIYQYSGFLAIPPARWIAKIVIEKKLKAFLDDIPLPKEVRQRIDGKVKHKNFMAQMVPFLLGVRELYMATEEDKTINFEKYILPLFPDPNAIPGLKHSKFTYGDPDFGEAHAVKEKKAISKIFLSQVIEVFDALLLNDDQYILGQKPKVGVELGEIAMPHVKKLLQLAIKEFELGPKVIEQILPILKDDLMIEALSISAAEAILMYAYKHYQMFAKKYHKQRVLKQWMKDELVKKDSKLWDYLEKNINERRYGIHIVVDGLQGNLMESLSASSPNNKFLKTIHKEHKNFKDFKPKDVPSKKMETVQQVDFLNYLVGRSSPFKEKNYLPFFKELYKSSNNSIAKNGLSTTPTISARNLPIAFTGAPVTGEHSTGITNFNFLDRENNRSYYFWGNDALQFDAIAEKNGQLTNFLRLPHLNSLNCSGSYFEGADWSFDPMINLVAGELQRDFGDILCIKELERRALNEVKASRLRARLLTYKEKIKKYNRFRRRYQNRGSFNRKDPTLAAHAIIQDLSELENDSLPTHLVYYNPWPDHFAHFTGPFADEIISPTGELNRLDYWLGRIKSIYKKAGVLNKTLFGMTGDHGLDPVYYVINPEVAVFEKMTNDGIEVKVHKVSVDEGGGPKLKHPLKPQSMKGFDVIVGSTAGGNHNMDLFIDQGSNWKKQPLISHLRNYQLLSGQKVDILDEILTNLGDTLDYLVVRNKEGTPSKTDTQILRKWNGKLHQGRVIRIDDRIFYSSKSDILQVRSPSRYRDISKNLSSAKKLQIKCLDKAKIDDPNTWCDESTWRELTSYSARPGSVGQTAHLYDTDLAGTINLFPAQGVAFNTTVPGRHAGELFHEKDAFVGVFGEPVGAKAKLQSEINGSIPRVIYEWLSGSQTSDESDIKYHQKGWGFDSFYKKVNIREKK
ncbi:MAG: hypothetical protein ACJAT2_002639 [Bacteriovoracaceae bacterium]|jgi:hypothetical protein